MSGMSEVWQDSDSTSISNESYHQTVAIQRLGHGHDWSDQPAGEQRQATRRAGRSPGRLQALLPRTTARNPAHAEDSGECKACHLTYTRSGGCERACNDLPAYTNTWKRKSEPWLAPRDDSCIGFKEPIESRCQIGSASIRILMNKANNYGKTCFN